MKTLEKIETLQEKIDKFVIENNSPTDRELFVWLQGTEYPGSETEYNGFSGHPPKRWWTLTHEDGEEEDFYL